MYPPLQGKIKEIKSRDEARDFLEDHDPIREAKKSLSDPDPISEAGSDHDSISEAGSDHDSISEAGSVFGDLYYDILCEIEPNLSGAAYWNILDHIYEVEKDGERAREFLLAHVPMKEIEIAHAQREKDLRDDK